jgi:hypothetical protein
MTISPALHNANSANQTWSTAANIVAGKVPATSTAFVESSVRPTVAAFLEKAWEHYQEHRAGPMSETDYHQFLLQQLEA